LKVKTAALVVYPDPETHQEVVRAFASGITVAMGMQT
jgi:hypothetical protein